MVLSGICMDRFDFKNKDSGMKKALIVSIINLQSSRGICIPSFLGLSGGTFAYQSHVLIMSYETPGPCHASM